MWNAMRVRLGPEWLTDSFQAVMSEYFDAGTVQGLQSIVLVAELAGNPVGFAEVSLREYAEGCLSSPVGYLEGWFVMPEARGNGVGAALVSAAEDWARSLGCSEMASDAEVENDASRRAHRALGFKEVCSIVCLRKSLDSPCERPKVD